MPSVGDRQICHLHLQVQVKMLNRGGQSDRQTHPSCQNTVECIETNFRKKKLLLRVTRHSGHHELYYTTSLIFIPWFSSPSSPVLKLPADRHHQSMRTSSSHCNHSRNSGCCRSLTSTKQHDQMEAAENICSSSFCSIH